MADFFRSGFGVDHRKGVFKLELGQVHSGRKGVVKGSQQPGRMDVTLGLSASRVRKGVVKRNQESRRTDVVGSASVLWMLGLQALSLAGIVSLRSIGAHRISIQVPTGQ